MRETEFQTSPGGPPTSTHRGPYTQPRCCTWTRTSSTARDSRRKRKRWARWLVVSSPIALACKGWLVRSIRGASTPYSGNGWQHLSRLVL